MMIKEKEKILLKHLRKDSRKSLSKISKETGISVSTLFYMLKRLEKRYIKKHVSLIDFSKLGYGFSASFFISTKDKAKVKEFLKRSKNVNTMSTTVNGADFYVECLFKDLKDNENFKESLRSTGVISVQEHMIVENIKKEEFSI